MYVSKSNYFTVQPQSILVTGLSKLSRAEVLEAAGLHEAVNNLTLDTTAVKNRLKSIPWVEKAELAKSLPDGLSLQISEYRPRAIVSYEHLYFIDAAGVPFKRLDPGETSDLPIIGGLSIDELLNPGPLVQDALGELFALIEVLDGRTDEFRTANISEFHFDHDRGLTLFTRHSGLEIKVGLGGYEKKFWRLGKVMAFLRQEELDVGLAYVNLETPPRVTVSYRGRPSPNAQALGRPGREPAV
ncbi:MAG: FtsQ-type POTRA domain-containing protein [Deltaproteobacteria bacterium]|nr:FtsQ-type POTRA domain-containing protein [Deltaproteobacteria bacterium]